MQIFNRINNNKTISYAERLNSYVERLKIVQNKIRELVKERDKISVPPLSNLITAQREDILDDLIPILTGYYSIDDVEKFNRKDKQLFLDTIKQIGLFLINFSETTDQYKSIIEEIKNLKQEEYEIKKKIGIE